MGKKCEDAYANWFYEILLSKAKLDSKSEINQIDEKLLYFVTVNFNSNDADVQALETYYDRLCRAICTFESYTSGDIQKKPFMIVFRDRFGTRNNYTPCNNEKVGIVHYHCILLLHPLTKNRFETFLNSRFNKSKKYTLDKDHGIKSIKQVHISAFKYEVCGIKRLIAYCSKLQTINSGFDNYTNDDVSCFPHYSERRKYFFYARNKTAQKLSSRGYKQMRWYEIVGKPEKADDQATVESALDGDRVGQTVTSSAVQAANANLKSAQKAKKIAQANKKSADAAKLRQAANQIR